MGNINLTVEQINALKPLEIIEHPVVRDRFIQIWETLWGGGEAAYQRESIYFNSLLRDKDGGKLQNTTPFSIFTAFIDLAVSGLSLEPGTRALAYLMGRSYNTGVKGQNGKDIYEGRLVLTVSAYGELVMRERAGQIRHADNPVIVYANDEFRYGDRDGRKFVDYVCNMPHNGQPIVACYLRITRADGSIDYSVMLPEDWERLAAYSGKQNRRWNDRERRWEFNPNALYGKQGDGAYNIDTGFLMAKCIKHAFKTYPKVRIGRGTELQSQQVDQIPEIDDDFYGVDTETGEVEPTAEAPQAELPQAQPGMVIDADDDEGF